MSKVLMLAVLAVFILCVANVPAARQSTADEIVARCAEAMGGLDNLEKIKTLRLKIIYPDHDAAVIAETERPNKIRSAGTATVLFDGKRGCFLERVAEDGTKTGPELIEPDQWKDFELDIAFYFPAFFDYPSEYLGTDTTEERQTHVIQVELPLGARVTYFIDAKSYHVIKTSAKVVIGGNEYHPERIFTDYKEVGSLIYPHKFTYSWRPGEKQEATIEKVELNVSFAPERFTIPASIR